MINRSSDMFQDARVYHLRDLLDEFRRGNIVLPRFHRSFVWDVTRRLELFDSIHKGIPIGSFMLWETRTLNLDYPVTEVDSILLPKPSNSRPHRYLIDGQQRLLTLFFALGEIEETVAGNKEFEVYYDTIEPAFITRNEFEEDSSFRYFPIRHVFDRMQALRFQRELALHLNENALASAIESIDSVIEAFRNCKIALTVFVTDDLALAAEAFRRVNASGISLSEVHMLHALSWRPTFDLIEEFDRVRDGLHAFPFWRSEDNLPNDNLLRLLKRLLRMNVFTTDIEQVTLKVSTEGIIERLWQSILRVAGYLATRGIRNPAHVPYSMMIIILGYVFDEVPEPKPEALNLLEDWLWFVSYTEAMSGLARSASYAVLEKQAIDIAKGSLPAQLKRIPSREPLPIHDFRSARSRALAWMFARRMMEQHVEDGASALAEFGGSSLVHLARGRTMVTTLSSASRVLTFPDKIEEIRAALKAGTSDERFLSAQVISPEALAALSSIPQDVKSFLRIRDRDLNAMEDAKFKEVTKNLFPTLR